VNNVVLVIVILVLVFGLVLQIALSDVLRKGIHFNIYLKFFVLIVINALLTVTFVLLLNYNADLLTLKIIKLLIFITNALFFVVYMYILKDRRHVRIWIVFVITTLVPFLGMFVFNHFDRTFIMWFFTLATIGASATLFTTKRYNSRHIMILVFLLFFTGFLHFVIESFIAYELIYYTDKSEWLTALSFLIKTLTIIFVVEVQNHIAINKNLAKTLDYQSPTSLLNLAFNEHPNAIVLTDVYERIVYVNPQALKITGYSESEVIGKTPRIFASGKTNKAVYQNMYQTLIEGKSWTGEFINRKKNGQLFVENSKIVNLKDMKGRPVFYLAIKADITNEVRYLEKLEHHMKHDDLTGALRRKYYLELIREHMNIQKGNPCYFLLFDIDNFKKINDTYGHLVGDEALVFFAKVLDMIFMDKGYICRFGGDEFSAFVYNVNVNELDKLINDLFSTLGHLSASKQENIYLKLSVGISKIEDNFEFNHVYDRTDKLLYQAKICDVNCVKKDF